MAADGVNGVRPAAQTQPATAQAQKAQPLTAQQQKALAKLHDASQQFESLFVDMLFKEMRKTAPQVSLTGKPSQADEMFGDMLDEKRSEELAKSDSLGIGAIVERQLRSAVLGQAGTAASTKVPKEGTP